MASRSGSGFDLTPPSAEARRKLEAALTREEADVLLRHGTANVTKSQNPWLQLGQIAGAVGGAVVGGQAGAAISETSQFGLGTLLLRYSRDYEKQADLLGAQIMARAGYDPRALARMFETIGAEQGAAVAPAAAGNRQALDFRDQVGAIAHELGIDAPGRAERRLDLLGGVLLS